MAASYSEKINPKREQLANAKIKWLGNKKIGFSFRIYKFKFKEMHFEFFLDCIMNCDVFNFFGLCQN